MKVPIDVIIEAISEYQPVSRFSSSDKQYSGLRFIQSMESETEPEQEAVYIGYGKNITPSCNFKNSSLILIGKPARGPFSDFKDLIILPESCNLYKISNILQDIFNSFSMLELDLTRTLFSGSYYDLVDIGHRFVKNPVFLIESGHRVIALAPDVDIPSDPEWSYLRRNGHTPFESIRTLKAAGHLDTMNTYKIPTLFTSLYFKFPLIVSNIYINSRFARRLIIIGTFKPFSRADFLSSKILTEAIKIKMEKDETYKFLRGEGPVYGMFYDLICGVKIDSNLIMDILQKYLPGWIKGFFRILYIPLDVIDDLTFDYYARILEKNTDVLCILFKNSLVSVLHYNNEKDFQTVQKTVSLFMSKNALTGGLSNEFGRMSELDEFYKQASIAYKFGKGTSMVHLYSDYMLKHLLSFYPPESIPFLCHPYLLRLKEFDNENGTQFFETLRTFLENERHLAKTAKALYIHRNTLLNRIDRMKEIFPLDMEDADTRLHLKLSYKLLTAVK